MTHSVHQLYRGNDAAMARFGTAPYAAAPSGGGRGENGILASLVRQWQEGRLNQLLVGGVFLLGYFLGSQNREARTTYSSVDPAVSGGGASLLKAARSSGQREVHVSSMCRCPSKAFPLPGRILEEGRDTGVIQPPSKATGEQAKHFTMHPYERSPDGSPGCTCVDDHKSAEPTVDGSLFDIKERCPAQHPTDWEWGEMPDFGVEENLPTFVGVLSYKSHQSLNATLHNWRHHGLFPRMNARDVYIQLNKRSEMDDAVMNEHQRILEENNEPPLTVMGTPDENLDPGKAISRFCRAAEAHPAGHPNGENLLLFLEKDWNLHDGLQTQNMEQIFRSIGALMQRGVQMVRLSPQVREVTFAESKLWYCPSQGVPWVCSTAHHHRWTNTPSVINCKWFLRYLEPFALLEDPIMYGCRDNFQQNRYSDWEEVLQDGRVAWTNSQWVLAHLAPPKPRMFFHNEVDQ